MATEANKSYFTPSPKLLKWITKTHVDLYEQTQGSIGSTVFQIGEKGTSLLRRMNVLLLTTKGRKSGIERKVTLPYFQYDDRIYVIASNAASEKHPDWYVNLMANPAVRIQLGAARFRAMAISLEGAEREALWNRHVSSWPRWAVYQERMSRKIPIVELRIA
jgi:deazaflavin-dependent oxidoreductase (nitroreductase family)